MKRNRLLLTFSVAFAMFSSTAIAAPSAKFAAVYSDTPALTSVAVITDSSIDKVVDMTTTGHTLLSIKVPQQKELLVGVSAEIGLLTDTTVKGKNGGTARAIAGGEAYVDIFAVPTGEYVVGAGGIHAKPGRVILSKRVQELTATLGGVIQSCSDEDINGTIDVATECDVTDEQIGLLQNTTAAHHFNFVLPDLEAGEYDIVAVFTTGSTAEIDICTSEAECSLYDPDGVVTGSAEAMAVINKTMVTAQEVRAVKGSINGVAIDVDTQECSADGVAVDCPE